MFICLSDVHHHVSTPPIIHTQKLTLSSLQTNADTFANSADPDETARNELSHQVLHCLLFCFRVLTQTPICSNGFVLIQKWKSPIQKNTGERVKSWIRRDLCNSGDFYNSVFF